MSESSDTHFRARAESAEQSLQAIFALIGDWMPPGSDLVDRDVIIAITALLEERHGFEFVAEDVIGKAPHRFSL